MNSSSKIAAGVLALVVVIGGGYLAMMPGTKVVTQPDVMVAKESAPTDSAADTSLTTAAPAPTAATDSFDDFGASLAADAQAQEAAMQSVDTSANSSVSSANSVNSANQPYDENSI